MSRLVIAVGASKAGTTTLFDLMRQHPAVAVTSIKETNFFFDDLEYTKGFSWFLENYFPISSDRQVLFEADNAYMCSRTCLQRIRDCDAGTRILVMLRNPAERAFSQWLYHVQMGRSCESFAEAIANEPTRITAGPSSVNRWGYLERGRYGKYLAQILELFPRGQVHVMVFEHFIRNQVAEFNRLAAWLGLPAASIEPLYSNATGRPRSRFIAGLMYDENLRILRSALSKPFRGHLKRRIIESVDRLNVAPYNNISRPKLDPVLKRQIMVSLESDVVLTERLAGLDLSIWRDMPNRAVG